WNVPEVRSGEHTLPERPRDVPLHQPGIAGVAHRAVGLEGRWREQPQGEAAQEASVADVGDVPGHDVEARLLLPPDLLVGDWKKFVLGEGLRAARRLSVEPDEARPEDVTLAPAHPHEEGLEIGVCTKGNPAPKVLVAGHLGQAVRAAEFRPGGRPAIVSKCCELGFPEAVPVCGETVPGHDPCRGRRPGQRADGPSAATYFHESSEAPA